MPSVEMSLFLPAAGDTELLGAVLAEAFPLNMGGVPNLGAVPNLAVAPNPGAVPNLAAAPNPGAVLYLQGELGAGKTTCVRSLLRRLGVTGLVRSPTYTLVETYATAALACVHVDLYRLVNESEAQDLGLRDLAAPGTLLMVEWPEKGGAAVPRADVALSLSYEGQARRARLRPFTQLGRSWALNLADDTRLAPYVSNIT